jgi:predicted transcriptional regulator
MEDVNMNTITLDTQLYKRTEAFAKSHNTSVKQLIESYIHSLVSETKSQKSELDLAREDLKAGRVLSYSSKEELYKDLGI